MSSLAKTLGISLLFFLGVTAAILASLPPKASIAETEILIVLHHSSPIALRVRLSAGTGSAIIAFSHSSTTPILLSVPGDWIRDEVKGVPLSAIVSEASLDGTSWTIPPGAAVQFRSPTPIDHLLLKNPTGIPLTLRATVADLQTNTSTFETYLVQFEQRIR